MNTWTNGTFVFVLNQVEAVVIGDNQPGASVGGTWYPLTKSDAQSLYEAVMETD
jgi:hypothetical protein